MSRVVFLAYPLTAVEVAIDRLQMFVDRLGDAFRTGCWSVRPAESGAQQIAASVGDGASALLASNIESVIGSDVLVVLAAAAREPSSIWVEVGMALACDIPIVVVCGDNAGMPFLVRQAALPGARRATWIRAQVPPQTEDVVIAAIVTAAEEARAQR